MFDVISGLPVHALVVHAVVVLLPLMAVVTVLVAAKPSWRGALRWTVVADALVLVSAVVADQSGEKLQARLTQAEGHVVAHEHGELGGTIPVFALALLLTAVFAWWANRRGGAVLLRLGVAAVTVAAVASVGMVVAVGHSGAQATWQEEIAHTKAPVGEVEDEAAR